MVAVSEACAPTVSLVPHERVTMLTHCARTTNSSTTSTTSSVINFLAPAFARPVIDFVAPALVITDENQRH